MEIGVNPLRDVQHQSNINRLNEIYKPDENGIYERDTYSQLFETKELLEEKFKAMEKLDAIGVDDSLKEIEKIFDEKGGIEGVYRPSYQLKLSDRKVFDYLKFALEKTIIPEGKIYHYLTSTNSSTVEASFIGAVDCKQETIYFLSNPYNVIAITLNSYTRHSYLFYEPVYTMDFVCSISRKRFTMISNRSHDENGYDVSIIGSADTCGFKHIKINECPVDIIENRWYLSRWIGSCWLHELIQDLEDRFEIKRGNSRKRQ